MDPIWNCILQVCCDPLLAPEKRTRAMARLIEQRCGLPREEAEAMAPHVLHAIQPLLDVLQPFIDFVAAGARGPDFDK